jgi:hypothetical protein
MSVSPEPENFLFKSLQGMPRSDKEAIIYS